jgi:uncharacterized protein (DUF2062 family)
MMQLLKKSRIFLLNFFAVIFAFAYLKPRKFIREAFSKKSLNTIIEQLYNPNQSDELKALSAAFGVFIGIIPIWGFQTLAAIFFAMVFKLNKVMVVIFSHISFPPMMPLIIFLSYKAGSYWMGNNIANITLSTRIAGVSINRNLEQYIYGSITLAIVAAISTGVITFALLKFIKLLKQYTLAVPLKKSL